MSFRSSIRTVEVAGVVNTTGGGAPAPTTAAWRSYTTSRMVGGGPQTISLPAGTVAGDMLVMSCNSNSGTFAGAPTGWTRLDATNLTMGYNAAIFYKVATADDISAGFVQIPNTGNGMACMVAIDTGFRTVRLVKKPSGSNATQLVALGSTPVNTAIVLIEHGGGEGSAGGPFFPQPQPATAVWTNGRPASSAYFTCCVPSFSFIAEAGSFSLQYAGDGNSECYVLALNA